VLLFATCGATACSGRAFTTEEVRVESSEPAPIATSALSAATAIVEAPKTDEPAAEDAGSPPRTPCGTIDAPVGGVLGRGEVCLEGGTFTMGSNQPNLGNGFSDHTPSHEVSVSPFVLDAFEVTRGRFAECVEDGACSVADEQVSHGCTWAAQDERLPITCVTWSQASDFCRWDHDRRLPTEAEWEFAARNGGGTSTYPWGSDFSCSRAALGAGTACPEFAGDRPQPAGAMASGCSSAGACDLAGNVAEWVLDWAGGYSSREQIDPVGPAVGASRILRGGSWKSSPQAGYSYARVSVSPESSGSWGFRCARDADQ
jgi:formylglycine-generating enzyme required for sulfatase activity